MSLDITTLFHAHEENRYELHIRHLNEQIVRVLKVTGYDVSSGGRRARICGTATAGTTSTSFRAGVVATSM